MRQSSRSRHSREPASVSCAASPWRSEIFCSPSFLAVPLGRVVAGFGNDGQSGFEGCRAGRVLGTYLHGPLLPKNSWFADWLTATALGVPEADLAPLDDTLEDAAHAAARRAAGV